MPRTGRSGICSCLSAPIRTPIGSRDRASRWTNGVRAHRRRIGPERQPLETSRQSVFAIGDVRSGSVERVAAAVGEGAQVVAALHDFLVATGRRNDVTWPFARMAREPGAGLATSLQPVHDGAPSA